MVQTVKDYLVSENERNKRNASLFTRILLHAFPEYQPEQVIIGHHLTFMFDNKLDTVDEVPSADTMMFDHFIMTRVFGSQAIAIMVELARWPVDKRDQILANYFAYVENPHAEDKAGA